MNLLSGLMKTDIFRRSLNKCVRIDFQSFGSAHLHYAQLGKTMNKGGIGCE